MKICRSINWRVWRKGRLDVSLFPTKPTYSHIRYARLNLATCLNYGFINAYVVSLSNKPHSSLLSTACKTSLYSCRVYSTLILWLNYDLCTLLRLYIGYSTVHAFSTNYALLTHCRYLSLKPRSTQIKETYRIRYFSLNRKL